MAPLSSVDQHRRRRQFRVRCLVEQLTSGESSDRQALGLFTWALAAWAADDTPGSGVGQSNVSDPEELKFLVRALFARLVDYDPGVWEQCLCFLRDWAEREDG